MVSSSPVVIGIAGGTGSGKTTIANILLERIGEDQIALLAHDAYYKDLSNLPETQRQNINFDHPDSLDTPLMIDHVQKLKAGIPVKVPIYDFKTHSRTDQFTLVSPQKIIIVEGILIFAEKELRELFDVKLFVDTDADIRFIRRLKRDIEERGRSTANIIDQYLNTVRPMHLQFVMPSKRYADVVIPEGGFNRVALDMVTARLEKLIQ